MITFRRSEERHHQPRVDAWITFHERHGAAAIADGFGALAILDEVFVSPGARVPQRPHHHCEIISYVRGGTLAYYEESTGGSGIMRAGEFQCMTAGFRTGRIEKNASRTARAQVFQLGFRQQPVALAQRHQHRRFGTAERRGALCLVAAPDARNGSLCIQQDALLYSAMLDPGRHVVHELSPGRSAWLHVVQGALTLADVRLTTGDGAGIASERAVSFTALEAAEVLLVDLAEAPPTYSVVPESEARECPVCRHVVQRDARRCGHCWSALTRPA